MQGLNDCPLMFVSAHCEKFPRGCCQKRTGECLSLTRFTCIDKMIMVITIMREREDEISVKKLLQTESKAPKYHDIIDCLIAAIEAKDGYTCGHSSRVADMSTDIASMLGIKGDRFENIHIAAHLHDIGKIGIPEHILNKPGALLPQEWSQVKEHPVTGYKILSKSSLLARVATIVLHHHERWDGKGYPHGLVGNQTPIGARIIAVADAIDAMITTRPYRKPLSWEECYHEISANKGRQFDPTVVDAAFSLRERWVAHRAQAQSCSSGW